MTDTMDTTRPGGGDIEARLIATLRAKAAQLPSASSPATPPFLPVPVSSIASPDAARSRRNRRPSRVAWIAVAAAVLVIAVLAVSLWFRSSDEESRTVTVPPGALASGGAPSWVPDGYEVIDARMDPGPQQSADTTESVQAFGADDRPDVLIEVGGILAAYPHEPTTPTVTVRGAPALVWLPGTGQVQPQETATASYPWASTQLTWNEGGTTIRATFRDLGLDDALRVLDAASWRAGSPLAGFDPAGFAPSALLAEALSERPDLLSTTLSYSSDLAHQQAPADLQVTVMGGVGSADAYFRMWATSGRGSDGSVVVASEYTGTYPDPSASSSDGVHQVAMRELDLRWPDGSGALLASPTLSADELERVARSVRPASPDDIAAVQAEASTRLAAFPAVASTVLPSGTLSLQEVGATDAICLTQAPSGPRCRLALGPLEGDRAAVTGDAVIDRTWYVFAVGRSAPLLYADDADRVATGTPTVSRDPSAPAMTTPFMATLPIESGVDGPYRFLLLRVPTGRDHLLVEVPDPTGGPIDLLRRPDA